MPFKKAPFIFFLFLSATTFITYFLAKKFELPHGLKGYYYANPSWRGEPAFVKRDSGVFTSLLRKRGKALDVNTFSVEWKGYLAIEKSGKYTFATVSDDGSSLYIDRQQVVDNGGIHGVKQESGQIYLKVGIYPIRIRYFQAGGSSRMDLSWAPWYRPLRNLPSSALLSEPVNYQDYKTERKVEYGLSFLKLIWLGTLAYLIGFYLCQKILSRSSLFSKTDGTYPKNPGRFSLQSYFPFPLLSILVFLRYAYVVKGCFIFDDFLHFFNLRWMTLAEYLVAPFGEHFLPLFKLEILALYNLFGYNSEAFFGTLLIVHSLSAFLLYRILQKMRVHTLVAIFFSGLWATSAVFFRGIEWFSAFGPIAFSNLSFLLALLLAIQVFDADGISLKYYMLVLGLALSPIFFISNYIPAVLTFPLAWSLNPTHEKIPKALFPLIPAFLIALAQISYLNPLSAVTDRPVILKSFPQTLLSLTSVGWSGLWGFPEHSVTIGVLLTLTFFVGVWMIRSNKVVLFQIVVLFVAILCFYSLVHFGRMSTYLAFAGFNLKAAVSTLIAYGRYHYFPTLLIALSVALLVEQVGIQFTGLQPLRDKIVGELRIGSLFLAGGSLILFVFIFKANTVRLEASTLTMVCSLNDMNNQDFISHITNDIMNTIYFHNSVESMNFFMGKDEYPGLAARFWLLKFHGPGAVNKLLPAGIEHHVRFVEPDTDIVTYWQEVYPEFGELLITKAPESVEVISLTE
jgi:hypothetical protein